MSVKSERLLNPEKPPRAPVGPGRPRDSRARSRFEEISVWSKRKKNLEKFPQRVSRTRGNKVDDMKLPNNEASFQWIVWIVHAVSRLWTQSI